MKSGHSYFVEHFSDIPAHDNTGNTQAIGNGLLLSPNQAVFIYDYVAINLVYARGFGMLGFDDEKITIVDIFNTAIPEQREACGEISGKAVSVVKSNNMEPLKNGIVLNYAGQTESADIVHLMLESSVFETDKHGNMISAFTTITKLPHLPIPKIVRWSVFGDMSDPLVEFVDEGLIHSNRISSRETEVLTKLADGKTMAKSASELFISSRTVEQHILNMRNRFDCANISQLVAFGKDMGLI